MTDIKDIKYRKKPVKDRAGNIAKAIYIITELLSDTEPIKWELREKSIKFLDSMDQGGLDDLLSLLDVAHQSDLISPMNFGIMKKELLSFRDALTKAKDQSIPSDFFPVPSSSSSIMADQGSQKSFPVGIPQNLERRPAILDFLKKNGESNLKRISLGTDLGTVYSEKTIRRELNALVEEGILRKTGEKRWSRYAVSSGLT